MKKILITGATGFVGMPLCGRMLREGRQVRGAVRTLSGREQLPPDVDAVLVGPIGSDTSWSAALEASALRWLMLAVALAGLAWLVFGVLRHGPDDGGV